MTTYQTIINTNGMSMSDLETVAKSVGANLDINRRQPLSRQRQAVLDAIRAKGVVIESTLTEKAISNF